MQTPRLTPTQLRWMTHLVIPLAIACGFVALLLGTCEVIVSPSVSGVGAIMLMLAELLVVGAICQLAYRPVRLRRLGDVEA